MKPADFMHNENDPSPYYHDSKTFENGSSSSFEAPRPKAGASGQCNIFLYCASRPRLQGGLAGHFPVTDLEMLPITRLHFCLHFSLDKGPPFF